MGSPPTRSTPSSLQSRLSSLSVCVCVWKRKRKRRLFYYINKRVHCWGRGERSLLTMKNPSEQLLQISNLIITAFLDSRLGYPLFFSALLKYQCFRRRWWWRGALWASWAKDVFHLLTRTEVTPLGLSSWLCHSSQSKSSFKGPCGEWTDRGCPSSSNSHWAWPPPCFRKHLNNVLWICLHKLSNSALKLTSHIATSWRS